MRALAITCAAVALIAAMLVLQGPGTVWGQEAGTCETKDMGTLGTEVDSTLQTDGSTLQLRLSAHSLFLLSLISNP